MTEKTFPGGRRHEMGPSNQPTALWINGDVVAAADAACKLLGCSRSELVRNAIRNAAMGMAVKRG